MLGIGWGILVGRGVLGKLLQNGGCALTMFLPASRHVEGCWLSHLGSSTLHCCAFLERMNWHQPSLSVFWKPPVDSFPTVALTIPCTATLPAPLPLCVSLCKATSTMLHSAPSSRLAVTTWQGDKQWFKHAASTHKDADVGA